MEFWIFEVITIIIAPLGNVSVSTQQILMCITSFFFLSFPFAVSIAATIQISRLLAKKRHNKARITAYICLIEGTAPMLITAGITYSLRDYIAYLFTNNADIAARVSALAPFNAGFQVLYGLYGALQGVLRATSHQVDILG